MVFLWNTINHGLTDSWHELKKAQWYIGTRNMVVNVLSTSIYYK